MSLMDRSIRGNVPSPTQSDISLGTLIYSNPRLPTLFNGNAESALNYLIAHAFPNYIATVATPGALPGSASPNDYYIVADDGDGKSAGYVWQVVDGAGAFHKRYDVDWSFEGIYAETLNRTQYMYYHKYGMTDKDASGTPIAGIYAGQKIFGGDATTQNLTFNANSADGTGYVQTDNHFRPTSDNSLDIGTSALKFKTGYFGTSLLVGTLTLVSGSITDTSGAIDFGDEDLSTTGDLSVGGLTATSFTIGTLTLASGSITDSSGSISFGDENLSTTGTLSAGVTTLDTTLVLATGSITDTTGAISFGNENLSTTGTLSAGNTTVTQLDCDFVRINGPTITTIPANQSLFLSANGTGVVECFVELVTVDITTTGVVDINGDLYVDNMLFTDNSINATDANGNIELVPSGTGTVVLFGPLTFIGDATYDIATSGVRAKDLYLSGSIGDGTTSISQATLQSFRDANVGVNIGDSLFWDGTQWLPSSPDTEITHGSLSGLTTGDAGHTQFVVLAGRSGGQTVQGGTAASEDLNLESTAHATKGFVKTKDDLVPFTNASYSGGWSGIDLGDSSFNFRDVYTKGEFFGIRPQNVSALPSNSAQNIGRMVYNTTDSKLYLDTGAAWVTAGSSSEKFSSDTVWNGTDTTKDVVVSATITEARTAIWQLCDNANDFERIYTVIKAISATTVRIEVSPALPAGSYRLIGFN